MAAIGRGFACANSASRCGASRASPPASPPLFAGACRPLAMKSEVDARPGGAGDVGVNTVADGEDFTLRHGAPGERGDRLDASA